MYLNLSTLVLGAADSLIGHHTHRLWMLLDQFRFATKSRSMSAGLGFCLVSTNSAPVWNKLILRGKNAHNAHSNHRISHVIQNLAIFVSICFIFFSLVWCIHACLCVLKAGTDTTSSPLDSPLTNQALTSVIDGLCPPSKTHTECECMQHSTSYVSPTIVLSETHHNKTT